MPVITSGSTTVGAVQLSGLAPNSTPIESWLNGLLNGKGYASQQTQAAIAAQYAIIELRNPAGSGKNVWVYSAAATRVTAGAVNVTIAGPPIGAAGGFKT